MSDKEIFSKLKDLNITTHRGKTEEETKDFKTLLEKIDQLMSR